MPYDVFISHSSKDKAAADAVCVALEGRGVGCWIAPRDIPPGADWGAAIVAAVAECRVLVLLHTADANRSEHVKREVERAVARGRPILPVRLAAGVPLSPTLEYFISTPHWLDASTPPLAAHLGKLADAVGRLLSASDPASPLPSSATAPAVPAAAPAGFGGQRWLVRAVAAGMAITAIGMAAFLSSRDGAPKGADQAAVVRPTTTTTPKGQPHDDHFEAAKKALEAVSGYTHFDEDGKLVVTFSEPLATFPTERLQSLDRLRTIYALHIGGGVAGGDLTSLRNLPNLASFEIMNAREFRDVRPAAGLQKLQWFRLYDAGVTDLGPLARSSSIAYVELHRTPVEDLTPLGEMTALETLTLLQARAGDLRSLAKSKRLRHLTLNGCQAIKDLGPLKDMPSLEHLDIQDMPWLKAEVDDLRHDRPDLRITVTP